MDDNLSTKSSESSLTTSGEYEIVTDSNITTPIEEQQLSSTASTTLVTTISSKSPTLNIANNQNINDLQHAMKDALREIDVNATDMSSNVRTMDDVLREVDVSTKPIPTAKSKVNQIQPTLIIENNSDLRKAMADVLREINTDSQKIVDVSKAVTLNKQKSLTLPLAGTSSPALLVPDNDSEQSQKQQQQQQQQQKQQLVPPNSVMKSQSLNRNHTADYATITPKGDDASSSEHNRVGQSVFYDCIDASPGVGVTVGGGSGVGGADVDGEVGVGVDEKQDLMKPEKNDTDEEVSEIDQGCTIFSGVTYLGAANINAPKSEIDIYRIMNELNSNSESVGLKISVSIPNCSDGLVVLHDAETKSVIATYEIQSIILYFRGPVETAENGCFAFTWLHGDSLFQCHVFRCHIPEAVNQVSACFQKAFRTYPASMTCSLTSAIDSNMMNSITSDVSGNPINTAGYEFIVSLEIREKVAKNSFSAVPRDRNHFKLRANTDKEVIITVKQTPSNVLQPLFIERCFGVLLSPGKLVRQGDMQLIDMVSMSYHIPSATSNANTNTTISSSTATAGGGGNVNSGIMVSGISHCDNTIAGGGGGGGAATPLCLQPYVIRAEWKANEAAFEQLNVEATKTFLTVAVDIVVRGIRDPVRFVIETPVVIQSASEIRIMDHFISKRPMTLRFYLQLERTHDEFSWKVSSIDPSEEINEPPQQSLLKFGMNNLSRIVRSSSIVSIEDECPTDYSSDGDEPLLSGTGEVSKDCSQDKLDEWDPILKEWDGEKRPKNLAALVRLGIPEALREKIWQKLANIESKTDMLDMYKILITKETKCETVIQRDIHRTFPAHKCFKESGGSGQDSLFKVSKAYAVYDTEVGYCQGLSFIAASLLLHMPEEDAFCVLVALMYDYGLRDLYKQGFEVLYLRLYQLDRLIKEQLPKLHEHFAACGIETHMYASQWFLTLFTARFPLCFVFHVLDVFLLDGVPLLFQVAVTLLSICEADLRQLDFEGILKYFRVTLPKKCRSSSQARRVMKMACERKIKKLKQYEEEFQIKKQHKERMEKEAQIYENRFGEEKRKLLTEIDDLHKKLIEANERAIEREKKHTGIIQDYKQIIQRFENDMTNMNETICNVMNIVTKCSKCVRQIENTDNSVRLPAVTTKSSGIKSQNNQQSCNKMATAGKDAPLGPLDPIHVATHRIRELELELAQAKLAHVEAECRNQDLNHQLNAAITELNSRGWQPWFSRTINTLQEKVTTRGSREAVLPTFQSYTQHPSASTSAAGSETNSPSSNQEFKAFSDGGSPKLPVKFQAVKLRNSIDSLRNIVVPLENSGGAGGGANLVGGLSVAEHFRQHLQPQSST